MVKPEDAQAYIDPTGKAKGRGAYVCLSVECLKKARKTKALERALDTSISEEVFAALEAGLEGMGAE